MITISINYTCIWQSDFASNYQFTKDGKCINTHTGRIVKKVYNSGSIGYNIKGKFYSLAKLRPHIKKIEKSKCPF